MGVFCEYFWENWPRFNGTAPYVKWTGITWVLPYELNTNPEIEPYPNSVPDIKINDMSNIVLITAPSILLHGKSRQKRQDYIWEKESTEQLGKIKHYFRCENKANKKQDIIILLYANTFA